MSFFAPWKPGQEAQALIAESQTRYDTAKRAVTIAERKAKHQLKLLGKAKLDTYESAITEFCNIFSKIKNTSSRTFKTADQKINADKMAVIKIQEISSQRVDAAVALIAGTAGGGLLGFGALGTVATFGAASTGTAISGLGGAAASNALLAWFGGGSLASGGLGVAGGTIVASGVFALPVLLIGPLVWSRMGEANLEKAKKFRIQVKKSVSEAEMITGSFDAISQRAKLMKSSLLKMQTSLTQINEQLSSLVSQQTDYRKMLPRQQEFLWAAVNYAKILMDVLEMPILHQNGEIVNNKTQFIAMSKEKAPTMEAENI